VIAERSRGRVRRWWALQVSDAEMARRLGVGPRTVCTMRARLGLPSWYARGRLNAAQRAARREAMLAALARAGSESLRQRGRGTAARRRADLAGRYGLPPDLFVTQIRATLALAGGPMTASQLAAALGLRPGGYRSFTTPQTRGNYLTDLCRRGLVARVPVDRGRGNRSGRGESLYLLTPLAMGLLAAAGTEAPRGE